MEQDCSEMQVDEEGYEDYEWEEYEADSRWYQEESKVSPSKESSFVIVDSTKNSPKAESSPKEKLQML